MIAGELPHFLSHHSYAGKHTTRLNNLTTSSLFDDHFQFPIPFPISNSISVSSFTDARTNHKSKVKLSTFVAQIPVHSFVLSIFARSEHDIV